MTGDASHRLVALDPVARPSHQPRPRYRSGGDVVSAADYDPLYVAMSQAGDEEDRLRKSWDRAESRTQTAAVWLADHIANGGDPDETAWYVEQYRTRRTEVTEAIDAYKAARTVREATYEAWETAGCPVSVGKPTRPVPAVTR